MTLKDVHQIRYTANSAKMAMIKVYETLPEELQDDETFEYFFLYLIQSLSIDLANWKSEDLRERTEEL